MPQRTLRWVWPRGAGLHRTWLRSGWSRWSGWSVQSSQIQTDVSSLRIFRSGLHCFHLVAACSGQLPLPAVHPTVVCPVARRAAGTSGMEREVCIRTQHVDSGDCTTSLLHHPWIPSQICQQHLLKSLLFKLLQFRRNAVEPGIQ